MFQYLMWSNPKSSANSEEQFFFDQHASLFNEVTNVFNDVSSLFGLIRADIVLTGLLSKKRLDYYLKNYTLDQLKKPMVIANSHSRLPYMEYENQKILIPTYPQELNHLYCDELSGIITGKYSPVLNDGKAFVIDPFLEYGNSLFDSSFTRLVKLGVSSKYSDCFYHPEFRSIFVIDKSGSLKEEIPIFDEGIKIPVMEDLFDRLDLVMKDYYNNDRLLFLQHLKEYGLISSRLYEDIQHNSEKNRNLIAQRMKK